MTDGVRRWTPPVLVAVTVAALVIVGALLATRGDADPVTAPSVTPTNAPTAEPTAAPGQRLVGNGGLVVSVPDAWPVDDYSCATDSRGDRVLVEGQFVRECLLHVVPGFVDVRVSPYDGGIATPTRLTTVVTRVVGGHEVEQWRTPVADSVDVTVWLRSRSADVDLTITGPPAEVARVAATLRPVPDGYAVVPDAGFGSGDGGTHGTYVETVRARFEAAGFEVVVRRDDSAGKVSDHRAGTVARLGTRVTLTFR